MIKVNVSEFRKNLPTYLGRVKTGEEVAVTSGGKVIARLIPEVDESRAALTDIVAANGLQVLPINPAIAFHATRNSSSTHGDPADRIIAGTALYHKAPLLTCDTRLRDMRDLRTVW